MRSLALAFSLLLLQIALGSGCASTAAPVSAASPKGPVEVTLDAKNDSVRLALGDSKYRIRLRKINDSRCPANAKCIWSGELAAEISVDRDLSGTRESKTFTLGEVTMTSITFAGATFELQSISETSVKLRVSAE